MKRVITLLLLLVAVAATINARTYVLITGVSNYNHPKIQNLPQATKDAKTVYNLMKARYPDTSILTGSNANCGNVLEKLGAIVNRAGKNDCIIFYYSGHGSNEGLLYSDGLMKYYNLLQKVKNASAGKIIFIFDACQSGGSLNAVNAMKQRGELNPGVAIIAASRADETATESPLVGAGFLTQALVKGMRGNADGNADKTVTLKELFKYIYNDVTVRSKSKQHPQLIAPARLNNAAIISFN